MYFEKKQIEGILQDNAPHYMSVLLFVDHISDLGQYSSPVGMIYLYLPECFLIVKKHNQYPVYQIHGYRGRKD